MLLDAVIEVLSILPSVSSSRTSKKRLNKKTATHTYHMLSLGRLFVGILLIYGNNGKMITNLRLGMLYRN